MKLRILVRAATAIATFALAVTATAIMTPIAASPPSHSQNEVAAAVNGHEPRAKPNTDWVAGWRAAAQPPMSGVSETGFSNQTVRMVIRADATGNELRVRLSNAYGAHPVAIGSISIAKHASGPGTVKDSRRAVTVDRNADFSIPVGAEVVSDPIRLPVTRGEDLVVSVFLPQATGPATWHRWAEATTYISEPGDWTSEPGGSPYQTTTPSWFFLDGVDVKGPVVSGTVVAFGDSITDGHYATIDRNGRWTDWLAHRNPKVSVINEGIGGNEILHDKPTGGESALNRIDRDIVNQLGVTDVILLEGINDIAGDATTGQVIDGMKQIIDSAHTHRLNIVGGTLTPWEGSSAYTAKRELVREQVNRWIRTSRAFDGFVDFDKVTRDPHNRHALRPRYDSGGGHIHPNDLGYKAMGDLVDLDMLRGR